MIRCYRCRPPPGAPLGPVRWVFVDDRTATETSWGRVIATYYDGRLARRAWERMRGCS